jgi:hypothetical protein
VLDFFFTDEFALLRPDETGHHLPDASAPLT